MDYMLLTDFAISNSDRHWNNFGILRDSETLEFISMAPIYDNGNSMFYNAYESLNRASLLRCEDTGILKRETDRLKLIKDRNLVDISKLSSSDEVEEFYRSYGIDELKTRIIRDSYENKIDLLMEYQYSIHIGYNIERYEYVSEVPVKKQ